MSDLVELVAYEHEHIRPEAPEGLMPLPGGPIINLGEFAPDGLAVVLPLSSVGTLTMRVNVAAIRADVLVGTAMKKGLIVGLPALKLGKYGTNQAVAVHVEGYTLINLNGREVNRAKLFPPSDEELDLAYQWLWPNE